MLVLLLGALSSPAVAQPWPRTPDDGVVVTLHGHNLVIPAPMLPKAHMGSFTSRLSVIDPIITIGMDKIVADPDQYRSLMNDTTRQNTISFSVDWLEDRQPTKIDPQEKLLNELWRGRFSVSTITAIGNDRSINARDELRNYECLRNRNGESNYIYKNIYYSKSFSIRHKTNVFHSCSGNFKIQYEIPEKWFSQDNFPDLQERLVAFFQKMLPDSRVEVFP
jgi:hypothetical protein